MEEGRSSITNSEAVYKGGDGTVIHKLEHMQIQADSLPSEVAWAA